MGSYRRLVPTAGPAVLLAGSLVACGGDDEPSAEAEATQQTTPGQSDTDASTGQQISTSQNSIGTFLGDGTVQATYDDW